ncbi:MULTISPECIES: folate-binding protein YgfZ [unclassified Hyphomicrobium]|uniref:CAF17-like 4Fe-4S cluster assembly/insertion protein YgfZ n=1 Tax=unclassified Hyphomicrobium TaxID=2619925 RepID=UPI000213D3C0|nr:MULTISPECIES: folate-binding protein YgfZ [unclassified Hyphomicrobium]CCB66837.1 putative Folate-binding protein YgfZ [Hyphomicrobium sp. MC1]
MSDIAKAAILHDRSVLEIGGADRTKFLQGLVTNDMRRVAPGTALYTGLLTGQGKLICDLFIMPDGEKLLVDIASSHVEKFIERLVKFKLRAEVTFGETETPLAVAAVWGSDVAARLGLDPRTMLTEKNSLPWTHHAFIDPRLPALGARLLFPVDLTVDIELARRGVTSATVEEYNAHRLALGVADTADIEGEICYPLEANFELLHGVDFKKGCYVGQELTARMKLKDKLRKRVLPVVSVASTSLPAVGTSVTANGAELGQLIAVSGLRGLALLRLDRLADAQMDAIRAGEVPLNINWPSWIPR